MEQHQELICTKQAADPLKAEIENLFQAQEELIHAKQEAVRASNLQKHQDHLRGLELFRQAFLKVIRVDSHSGSLSQQEFESLSGFDLLQGELADKMAAIVKLFQPYLNYGLTVWKAEFPGCVFRYELYWKVDLGNAQPAPTGQKPKRKHKR